MNKAIKSYYLLFICIGVCASSSIGNEFIKQSKEKKFYPSCQQCGELKWRIISEANTVRRLLSDLEGPKIAEITSYIQGEKDCLLQQSTKQQRARSYAEDQKKLDALQEIQSTLRSLLS